LLAHTQTNKMRRVMDQQEVHISSMVVHVKPDHLQTVKNDIEQLPGTEIHGEADSGKIVVVLETQSQGCARLACQTLKDGARSYLPISSREVQ